MNKLLLAALLLVGCTPKTPVQVADKFVDLYFVEVDQARALALSSGLARSKLEEELSLVEKVRQSYDPEQAKPSIYYVRRDSQVQGEHARMTYDITIKQGRDESKRNALISVELTDGKWTVGNFIVKEEHAPAALPRPAP